MDSGESQLPRGYARETGEASRPRGFYKTLLESLDVQHELCRRVVEHLGWDHALAFALEPGRGYFAREFRRYVDCGLVHDFAPERHADFAPVRRSASIAGLCAVSFTLAPGTF
jgi:hypothetical protein